MPHNSINNRPFVFIFLQENKAFTGHIKENGVKVDNKTCKGKSLNLHQLVSLGNQLCFGGLHVSSSVSHHPPCYASGGKNEKKKRSRYNMNISVRLTTLSKPNSAYLYHLIEIIQNFYSLCNFFLILFIPYFPSLFLCD